MTLCTHNILRTPLLYSRSAELKLIYMPQNKKSKSDIAGHGMHMYSIVSWWCTPKAVLAGQPFDSIPAGRHSTSVENGCIRLQAPHC